MSWQLKIKAASLAEEQKIIRRIERKLKRMRNRRAQTYLHVEPNDAMRSSMCLVPGKDPLGYVRWGNARLLEAQAHRRNIVRPEARRTHLARMFLRGVAYKRVEQKVHDNNKLSDGEWNAIQRMAEKYATYAKMSDQNPPAWMYRSVQQLAQKFEEWRQAGA